MEETNGTITEEPNARNESRGTKRAESLRVAEGSLTNGTLCPWKVSGGKLEGKLGVICGGSFGKSTTENVAEDMWRIYEGSTEGIFKF